LRFLPLIAVYATVALAAEPPAFTGPGSCASPNCHGGVQPRSDNAVWQNEYSTWVVKDKHAQAYAVLSNPVASRMARTLGLPSADTAAKCLACHALDPPANQRARTFDAADGVSCESCHGPASNWLGPHTTKNWSHQQSIDAGMYDQRDLIRRNERCLSCHLGTREKSVDHEMIAAGHPDLYFELASFSAVMPRHWREPYDKDPFIEVRELAVGQAVQFREELRRLERESKDGNWPEYGELDCFACHHSVTSAADSWRQAQGYAARRPGNPQWNLSRYVILRQVVNETDRASAQQLESGVNRLYALVSAPGSGRAEITAQASGLSEIADRVANRLAGAQFDGALAERLLHGISGDADSISSAGERSAEQAAMSLDALFVAYTRTVRVANADQVRASIQALFAQLNDPSSYNAPQYAQAMRQVNGLLR
jgi:Cytochrome c554 and c-prime